MKGTKHPKIIERYWYSIAWDVPALWALDLPVFEIPMKHLEWHLDAPVWPNEAGEGYRVSPRQVVENARENPTEFARIQSADLGFPIEVLERKNRWMILDGIHRLTKAYLMGQAQIRARKVPQSAVQRLK